VSKNYKETLNLPQTDFPMRAGLAKREPEWLAKWDKEDLYGRLQKAQQDRPVFILHDGPPYANAALHLGHAVNKILKDIIVKSRMLSGFRAPYVPGWDCHGLPIELMVEKKIGKVGDKVDARSFREACREHAAQQIDLQREVFKRMGVLGDWHNPYRTMDFSYEADIIRAFAKIFERGYVTRGVKPVHWCVECGSALAEAEVEYQDKVSPSVDVRYRAVDPENMVRMFSSPDEGPGGPVVWDSETPVNVVIWTTTPWTLPASQAVAAHAELSYVLVAVAGNAGPEWIIVAEDLLGACLERWGDPAAEILGRASGQQLEHAMLHHPFYQRELPMILGDHVTLETGTGAVHTAPGHGHEDFEMGQRYGLPVVNPVDDDGRFVADLEFFGGENIFKANDHIIQVMRDNGSLVHSEKFEHSYPHCWRHKTPTAFRVTPQWFINMDQTNLRRDALEAIKHNQWVPGWGKERMYGMIESRPDWCISRQRTWGVPIALFVQVKTGEPHPDSVALLGRVADLVESAGIDAWYDMDAHQFLGSEADEYEKVTDILDVWFDSGVSHYAVLERREELQCPADVYIEGSDQHRGWFQSSLLTGVAMDGKSPYKAALTHGFTVDAGGRKMSKSLGNVVAPDKVMNSLGADVLRLWVSATDYSGELAASDEILRRMADSYRRIRNTARFLLGNVHDFDPSVDLLPMEDLLPLDRWAVDRAAEIQEQILKDYEDYQFHLIYQRVHNFCSVDMGAFYLDVIKDRLYTTRKDSHARRSAQTAMYHVLEALVRWIAPILSFTADEIWGQMPGERSDSVLFETWYTGLPEEPQSAPFDAAFWKTVLKVREGVNRELEDKRTAGEIGANLDADVTIRANGSVLEKLNLLDDELRFLLITSGAEAVDRSGVADGEAVVIDAGKSGYAKCGRCWHRREDVGVSEGHPELCGRCVSNVEGPGETRRFV